MIGDGRTLSLGLVSEYQLQNINDQHINNQNEILPALLRRGVALLRRGVAQRLLSSN